ncbi:MAG: hypothetical protein KBS84_02515 [Treponema sp.]|nr:hypothetical protein [Candidatus Treponema scatequi]
MFETIDKDTKLKGKTYLVFTSLIIVMALILTGFSLLARKSWNEQLKEQVQTVLEKSRPDDFPSKYTIGKPVKINSSLAVSSNMYKITSSTSNAKKYVLITRVTSYWGPLAAVFLYDKESGVSFEGFALSSERIETQFTNTEADITIKHWTEKAKIIFEQTLDTGDKK